MALFYVIKVIVKTTYTNNMHLTIELFDLYIEKRSRSWFSLLEINKDTSLVYIEWGQGWKIQISILFGLIKNF